MKAIDDDWMVAAACRGMPSDLFFPSSGVTKTGWVWEQARRICRDCPVRLECLVFALSWNQEVGMWGGVSPSKRAKLRKRIRRGSSVVDVARAEVYVGMAASEEAS